MTTPISDYWYDEPEPMEDVVNGGGTVVVANGGGRLRKAVRPNPLPYANRRTGICYDVRMRFHATIDDDEMHPEDPRRIMEIYKAIVEAGLVDDPNYVGAVKKGDLMIGIDARPVTKQEALLVHSQEHWDFLAATKG
jgi:histone deacetylase 6